MGPQFQVTDRVPVRKARRVVAPRGSGTRVSGPMWAGQVWGPSHSRTSPRRQALSLFRSFRGIGISGHQPCKKSSEENGSTGLRATTISGHRGRVCAGPCTGPFGPRLKAPECRGAPARPPPRVSAPRL